MRSSLLVYSIVIGISHLPQGAFSQQITNREITIASNKRDYSLPVSQVETLALAGDSVAQSYLGSKYLLGVGVKANPKESLRWYTKAAESGRKDAMHNVAIAYYTGCGVAQNYKTAMVWFKKAAENNMGSSQYNIGVMYAKGQGVKKDLCEAKKWYQLAADNGVPEAELDLGTFLLNGVCAERDTNGAISLYVMAARKGEMRAFYNLVIVYYHGKGIQRDLVQAYKYNLLMSYGHNEPLDKWRDIMETEMTCQEIEQAKEEASKWEPILAYPEQELGLVP